MGEIGVSHETALYAMRLWQIQAAINGYRRREVEAWRRERWQTWAILCAMGCKDLQRPDDLMELPGDGAADEVEVSDEEYQAAMALIRQANGDGTTADAAGTVAEPAGG